MSAAITKKTIDATFDPAEANERANMIVRARTVQDKKKAVKAFIDYAEIHKKKRPAMCKRLMEDINRFRMGYYLRSFIVKDEMKVVNIEPREAFAFLLALFVSPDLTPIRIIAALRRFCEECDKYVEPMLERITEEEIKMVLEQAQSKYKLMDIIAPKNYLYIVRYDNSHVKFDSSCRVLGDASKWSACVELYHPRVDTNHDRIFIFAHELGHALHFALTKNFKEIPASFTEFNEMLDVEMDSVEVAQECFADITAHGILCHSHLESHLPTNIDDELNSTFESYVKLATSEYLQAHPVESNDRDEDD